MSSKKLNFGLLSVLGLIAILGIAGFIAYKKGIFGQKLTPVKGAKVIPDEAIMTSFISTDEQDWQELKNLGGGAVAEIFKEATNEIETEIAQLSIDYQQDIKPWLGNAMVAVVPKKEDSTEANILLVLGIKNPINAYKFFNKFKNQEKTNLEFVKHQGITINLAKNEQEETTNMAFLGGKVIISDQISTVKKAINTYKGEPSLVTNADNLKIIRKPFSTKNSLVEIYFPDYDRFLENSINNLDTSQEQLDKIQPLESIILGFAVADNQLKIQSFAKLKPGIDLTEGQPIKNKLVSNYPEQTIALISGQGISEFWSELVEIGEQDRGFKAMIEGMRYSTRVTTGLNLDRDIFGWMDGEFALGIVKTDQAAIAEIDLKLGTAIVLETSDRNTAQNTLNSLQNILQQQVGITTNTKNIQKQTITQWNFPYTDLDISYSWLDDKNLVFTIGNNVVDSMNKSATNSLKENPKFQQFIAKLPNQSFSYFYFDIEEVITTMKQIPGFYESYNPESMAILDSIQGVSAASTMPDSRTAKTDLVVWFK